MGKGKGDGEWGGVGSVAWGRALGGELTAVGRRDIKVLRGVWSVRREANGGVNWGVNTCHARLPAHMTRGARATCLN